MTDTADTASYADDKTPNSAGKNNVIYKKIIKKISQTFYMIP